LNGDISSLKELAESNKETLLFFQKKLTETKNEEDESQDSKGKLSGRAV